MLSLQTGDVVGIASPSHPMNEADCLPFFEQIEKMGLRVQPARNLCACSWGYAASPDERADEVLPLIDYEAAKRQEKIYLSYSDGTSILNAIHARTGQTVLYGQAPWHLIDPQPYNRDMLRAYLFEGGLREHKKALPWRTIREGRAHGILTGGYLDNYVYLANASWVKPEAGEDYVLFLEDHEQFFGVPHISDLFARLSAAPIMRQVRGLLFGHYSEKANAHLERCLWHFGEKWNIPVAICDDFGHGKYAAILPIGEKAELDATRQTLVYPEIKK